MPDEKKGDVEGQAATFLPNPMDEIRAEENEQARSALETALVDAKKPPEKDAVGDGKTSEKRDDSGSSTSLKRPGIDVVLSELEKTNPQFAEVVRAQQATITRLQTGEKDLDKRVEQTVKEALAEAMKEAEGEPEKDPALANYTPEQIAQFKETARKLGLVLKEDEDQKAQQKSLQDYFLEGRSAALTEFGESFGKLGEDGKFIFAEGIEDKAQQELLRIQRYGTVNARDLFILATFKDQIKAAEDRGYEKAKKEIGPVAKAARMKGAITESGSAPVEAAVNIRGKSGSPDDSFDKVFERAAVLAKRKLAASAR